jgi:hypothetical protein
VKIADSGQAAQDYFFKKLEISKIKNIYFILKMAISFLLRFYSENTWVFFQNFKNEKYLFYIENAYTVFTPFLLWKYLSVFQKISKIRNIYFWKWLYLLSTRFAMLLYAKDNWYGSSRFHFLLFKEANLLSKAPVQCSSCIVLGWTWQHLSWGRTTIGRE